MFSTILQRFMEKAPIPVMVRALLEQVLTPQRLDDIFKSSSIKQYTRSLLFSSIFDLMSLVVLNVFPSINAAYQTRKSKLSVSGTAVYDKLNGLETGVSANLVRATSHELGKIIEALSGKKADWLPGYRIKALDGNCLEATEHRLSVLRQTGAGALPGKSLVVYDPMLEMAVDVFPCEDGHAQERSLLDGVLKTVEKNDVLIMDRNFCVRGFLFGIEDVGGYFIVRHHKQLPLKSAGAFEFKGETETGQVFEQQVYVEDGQRGCRWRCIKVKLKKATRDGEKEIVILTDLPESAASAVEIAQLYRKRWTQETMFQELEAHLHSEINTLGYPKAALFGFCVALVAYNILAVVKAALRSVHGEEKIANEVSGYYIAGEIERTHEGMEVAMEDREWAVFQTMTCAEFAKVLQVLAGNVQLQKYKKHRRGPKKPSTKPKASKHQPHVSTARLLLNKISP